MARRPKKTAKKIFAGLIGFLFVVIGVASVIGIEIYWQRIVVPERKGMSSAISITPGKADSQNDGKLVYLTGMLIGNEQLIDAEFNISTNALKLRRKVWAFQWQQEN